MDIPNSNPLTRKTLLRSKLYYSILESSNRFRNCTSSYMYQKLYFHKHIDLFAVPVHFLCYL